MTTLVTPRLPRSNKPPARKPAPAADERPLLQDPHYAILNLLYAALMHGAPSKSENQKSNTSPEVHHGS